MGFGSVRACGWVCRHRDDGGIATRDRIVDNRMVAHQSRRTCLRAAILTVLTGVALLAMTAGDVQAESRTIEVGGVSRTFDLFIPAAVRARNKPVPLVVALHGGGGQGRQMESISGWDAVAERVGFAVAYPNGLRRHWNDGRGDTVVGAAADDTDGAAARGERCHDAGRADRTGMRGADGALHGAGWRTPRAARGPALAASRPVSRRDQSRHRQRGRDLVVFQRALTRRWCRQPHPQ